MSRKQVKFYILVFTMENTVNLASILDIENAVQLERNEKFAKLSSRPWRFINDGHWNEYGNFAAALGLIDKRSQVNLTYNIKIPSALFIDRHIPKDRHLYRWHVSWLVPCRPLLNFQRRLEEFSQSNGHPVFLYPMIEHYNWPKLFSVILIATFMMTP